jgi:hypothetical protein
MYEDGCVLERSLGLEFVRVPVRHGRGDVGRVEQCMVGRVGVLWIGLGVCRT